jgi:ADP-heptose:LPS heptosyltransferase
MRKIIISPYSRGMRNNKQNPKNYPYWGELVKLLKEQDCYIIQIGRTGELRIDGIDEIKYDLPLDSLTTLVSECTTWVSVDNFFPHLCHLVKKSGVVIFGKSDPNIFGHEQNINVLKDRSYLRPHQFDMWESENYETDCFVDANNVAKDILRIIN